MNNNQFLENANQQQEIRKTQKKKVLKLYFCKKQFQESYLSRLKNNLFYCFYHYFSQFTSFLQNIVYFIAYTFSYFQIQPLNIYKKLTN